MKFIVIFAVFSYVVATESTPISGNNELINNTKTVVSTEDTNSNTVHATTEMTLNKTVADDEEATSEEVDELVSELQVLLAEVTDESLQKCIESNDTDAFKKAKAADNELIECFSPVIDPLIAMLPDVESLGINILRNISEHFCKTYPAIHENCLNKYYSSIKPCLSDSDLKGIIMYDKILNTATEYLCKYEADFLIEAIQNEFGCSPLKHSIGVAFCTVPPFQELVRNNNTHLAVPRSLVGKGCQLYKDMAQCINNELSSCKNATYSDIIVGFFNATADALPECPSERTEWEEHVGQVLGDLFKVEQEQTGLLKLVKQQLEHLVATNAEQVKFLKEDRQVKIKEKDDINTILKILSGIQMTANYHL